MNKNQAQRIHHISSHFTNGLFPAASICITLFLLTGNFCYETATLWICTIAVISAPIVYSSGLFDWRNRFQTRKARIFLRKRNIGLVLVLLAAILIISRFYLGDRFFLFGTMKYFYAVYTYMLTGLATYLGYLGGKFIV